jgi:hypothetical protein
MSFSWNTPFSAPPQGFNFLGSGGAGLASGFGGAASGAAGAAGAAGGASGMLSALGGPWGMAAGAGLNLVGGVLEGIQAGHAQKGAMNAQRVQQANMLAAREYEAEQALNRQLRAKMMERDMRIAGINRPEYFNAFMQGGMSPTAAARWSYSPIMRT